VGTELGDIYKTKITDINMEKMDFSNITFEGQTALGPALAVALGIVSKHGEGSSIVVVTDGIANLGIL
jgi:Mg-chelatase subunit ChlD